MGREAEWRLVPVVALFGLSAHALKHSLAPVGPALQEAGLSPLMYAFVAASPMVGAIVAPVLWGWQYKSFEKPVLLAVPSGELLGQVLILLGLLSGARSSRVTGAEVGFLALGLGVFSLCHGGVGVCQHTSLARILPRRLSIGFVCIIVCTHATSACCNFIVPRVLRLYGLVGVQLLLLIPGVGSVLAGLLLAHFSVAFPVPHRDTLLSTRTHSLDGNESQPQDEAWSVQRLDSVVQADLVILLIALWRAVLLGSMHSFQTVMNNLLVVTFDMSAEEAGAMLAANQFFALCLLPLLAAIADARGRRGFVIAVSWVAFAAALLLSQGAPLPRSALDLAIFLWSFAGLYSPILPLVLVPSNSRRSLGRSFGILDGVFSAAEVIFVLLFGILREAGGFPYALVLLCSALAVSGVLSIFVALVVRDDHKSPLDEAPLDEAPLAMTAIRSLNPHTALIS